MSSSNGSFIVRPDERGHLSLRKSYIFNKLKSLPPPQLIAVQLISLGIDCCVIFIREEMKNISSGEQVRAFSSLIATYSSDTTFCRPP